MKCFLQRPTPHCQSAQRDAVRSDSERAAIWRQTGGRSALLPGHPVPQQPVFWERRGRPAKAALAPSGTASIPYLCLLFLLPSKHRKQTVSPRFPPPPPPLSLPSLPPSASSCVCRQRKNFTCTSPFLHFGSRGFMWTNTSFRSIMFTGNF